MPKLLDVIDKFVKLPAWLVWVGLALAILVTSLSDAGRFAKFTIVVALLVAVTGFIYDKIYP